MARENFLWVEKYRPHTIENCVLPDRLKKVFQTFVDEGRIPHLLLSGSPGTGKTTVARALCDEIGISYMFINSSEERGIDTLRMKIKQYASTVSMDGRQKAIIMDEADYITPEAQAALRGAMEQLASNCTFILTCNYASKLIDAIHSRCTNIDFKLDKTEKASMALQFMQRVERILGVEKVEFDKKVLARIIQNFFPDFRRTINELQRLSKLGPIDAGALAQVHGVRALDELFGYLKEKDFKAMRKWVVDNGDVDQNTLFRSIYMALSDKLTPRTIPQAVLILARYQYQSAFVADQELNLVAALTEIMVDTELK